jgi:hypothetical protein
MVMSDSMQTTQGMAVGRGHACFGIVFRAPAYTGQSAVLLTRSRAKQHALRMKTQHTQFTQQWNHFASFNALAHAEDLVCLSRVRWRWADPRVKAVLALAAQAWRVFFVEVSPPAWLNSLEWAGAAQGVVRVGATHSGVWTVRPGSTSALPGRKPARALSRVLRAFFEEAGVHEPVVWHLDAIEPDALGVHPAWATLYTRPEVHSATFFDPKERANDVSLREQSDVLLDAQLLSQPPGIAWSAICDEIMRAVCRRAAMPRLQFLAD